mgnify:CR=1 FL=1
MKRVNYHLTEKQIEALRRAAEETGLSVAELIRRAIDEWLKQTDMVNSKKHLAKANYD